MSADDIARIRRVYVFLKCFFLLSICLFIYLEGNKTEREEEEKQRDTHRQIGSGRERGRLIFLVNLFFTCR